MPQRWNGNNSCHCPAATGEDCELTLEECRTRAGPLAAHLNAAARFKQFFVPVTYAEEPTDSLERRMLKKIYNVAAAVKHRGDGKISETELRTIHSAAFAGVDGPDPDFDL